MTTATAGVPVVTSEQVNWFARAFGALVTNIEQAVLGKQHIVRLALTCLVSEGHLLLEDYPGTGKTSLAKAIANSVQGTHSRIQFTPDLLPSDVTGVTIYDQRSGQFELPRRARSSRRSCWPTRSTGPRRRPSPRSLRSWRRAGSRWTARRTRSAARSW